MQQTIVRSILAFICAILAAVQLPAAEFFVAPSGMPMGDGSRASPWDLTTALAQPTAVKPGDTIWLLGGTYAGSFTSRLRGTPDAPIVVRQFPGERATIDCRPQDKRPAMFLVEGAHVRFQGFEVTCSDERRSTTLTGSWPADLDRGGIFCRATDASFINLIVHDTSNGFGFWSEGEGGEIYGCLIYNNGWRGPDRGHGHGIYTQNLRGTKRLVENVIFNQFGGGIHAYGSEKASLEGFHIEGNALFNNGSLTKPGERTVNLLVGGGARAARIAVVGNYTYYTDLAGTSVQLGYSARNDDLVLRDNYLAGFVRMLPWDRVTASGNTFVGYTSLVELHAADRASLDKYEWDRNTYLSAERAYTPLSVVLGKQRLAGWQQWRESAGLDRQGEYIVGNPRGKAVFVRPNKYEPGRANIVIYNWDRAETIEVDLQNVLKSGQQYRLVSAQDFFGKAIARGTYDGKPVAISMGETTRAAPAGMSDYALPVTEPEFGVYVLLTE